MSSTGSGFSSDGRKLGAGAIASLTGMGLLIVFMIQNTDDVRLDFLIWHFTWPLWLPRSPRRSWVRSSGSGWV